MTDAEKRARDHKLWHAPECTCLQEAMTDPFDIPSGLSLLDTISHCLGEIERLTEELSRERNRGDQLEGLVRIGRRTVSPPVGWYSFAMTTAHESDEITQHLCSKVCIAGFASISDVRG